MTKRKKTTVKSEVEPIEIEPWLQRQRKWRRSEIFFQDYSFYLLTIVNKIKFVMKKFREGTKTNSSDDNEHSSEYLIKLKAT